MVSLAEWLPYALVGGIFTLFGLLKLYGVWRGINGGRDKSLFEYACGT